MNRTRTRGLLVTLSLLCCAPLWAATVYKSVDANGVVTYSDTRPEEGVPVETLVIEVQEPVASDVTGQRLEEMRATTDRMAADRMARERHRAELRQLDADEARLASEQDATGYEAGPDVYTGYYPYPARWPLWHRPDPRPEHPIVRPPYLRPTPQWPTNSRPPPSSDYPASLVRRHYNPKVRASLD